MGLKSTKWQGWDIITFDAKVMIRDRRDEKRLFSTLEELRTTRIALDFSKTQYIDSSSITLLLNFKKRLPADGELVLFGINQDVKELFTIVALYDYFVIFDTRLQFEEYARAKAT
jgi:anti-anti-sigma factor